MTLYILPLEFLVQKSKMALVSRMKKIKIKF